MLVVDAEPKCQTAMRSTPIATLRGSVRERVRTGTRGGRRATSRELHFAERHRADDQRRRLRAGVAAAGDDERHEEREDDRARSPPRSSAIAVAVSISPIKSTASQPARFFIMSKKPMSMYGSSSASIPPSFCMSSVLFLQTTSITSSTVMMPRSRPILVDDGNGGQVVVRDQLRALLLGRRARARSRRLQSSLPSFVLGRLSTSSRSDRTPNSSPSSVV